MENKFITPKAEKHLDLKIPGVKPIVACIATENDFRRGEMIGAESLISAKKRVINGTASHNIDFDENADILTRKKFLNNGDDTYIISVIDGKNKYSKKFLDCTGFVVTGIDRLTGKNISFLSHQNPSSFLADKKSYFINDLHLQLEEIKKRCLPGSIDAVIIGGNSSTVHHPLGPDFSTVYLQSIKLLSQETQKVLGFDPVDINGPKPAVSNYKDEVYYDNDNRALYFIRPIVNKSTGSFPAGDALKHGDKWY